MKKIIVALLIISLILMTACESKETKLKKESQAAQLDQAIAQAKATCPSDDDYNYTFCLAERAEEINQLRLEFRQETDLEYPDAVKALCPETSNPDLCYFYSAVKAGDSQYCSQIEDKEGCRMITNDYYCNGFVNKNQCLANRAFMLQYLNKAKAEVICQSLPAEYQQSVEDDVNCGDIEFGYDEFDEKPFNERFLLTYVMSAMAGFEIDYVTVGK